MSSESTACTVGGCQNRKKELGTAPLDLAVLCSRGDRRQEANPGSSPGRAEPLSGEVLLVAPAEQATEALIEALAHQEQRLSHCSDALSALLGLRTTSWPEAILITSDLQDVSSLELCLTLRNFGYRGPLLILRQSDCSASKVAALDAGADDVIDASADAEEIAARLRAQSRRLSVLPGDAWPGLWTPGPAGRAQPGMTGFTVRERLNPLTPREQDVLEQMVLGLGNSEIAERLFLSLETVKTHVRNLMGKLKARHRTQAVIKALQSGYCLLPEGGEGSRRPNRVGC